MIVEDEHFAAEMREMYLADLANATEIVLDLRNRVRAPGAPRPPRARARRTGSGGRAITGAMRIGRTVTAAIANRRMLEPVEAHIALVAGMLFAAVAVVAFSWPWAVAYPLAAVSVWFAAALAYRGLRLRRRRRR